MDQTLRLNVLQCFANIANDLRCVGDVNGSRPFQDLTECHAINEFGNQYRQTVDFSGVVSGDDMGMFESSNQPHL